MLAGNDPLLEPYLKPVLVHLNNVRYISGRLGCLRPFLALCSFNFILDAVRMLIFPTSLCSSKPAEDYILGLCLIPLWILVDATISFMSVALGWSIYSLKTPKERGSATYSRVEQPPEQSRPQNPAGLAAERRRQLDLSGTTDGRYEADLREAIQRSVEEQ